MPKTPLPPPVVDDTSFRAYIVDGVPFLVTTLDREDGSYRLVGTMSTKCGMRLEASYGFDDEDARDNRFEDRKHDGRLFHGLMELREKAAGFIAKGAAS